MLGTEEMKNVGPREEWKEGVKEGANGKEDRKGSWRRKKKEDKVLNKEGEVMDLRKI